MTSEKITQEDKRHFILDTLLPYFIDPTTRSLGEDGSGCYYRAPNGNKCAVGKHIPDDKYVPDMEADALELFDRYPNCLSDEAAAMQFSDLTWECIQAVHDYCFTKDGKFTTRASSHIDDLEKETGFKFPELRAFL